MKTSKQLMGTGIVTAIAASFCCITPLLAFISGATGVASSLSWLEPFRPYFMGITLLVLSVSWYQKLKARKTGTIACDCDDGTKTSFLQSKVFLGLVTLFAISMLSFPYYGNVLYPNTDKPASMVVVPEYRTEITIPITDMTCASCEAHITHSIYALDGIISAQVDYTHKSAYVTYDNSIVTLKALYTQIKKAGYTPKEAP